MPAWLDNLFILPSERQTIAETQQQLNDAAWRLHAAGKITDEQYRKFQELAAKATIETSLAQLAASGESPSQAFTAELKLGIERLPAQIGGAIGTTAGGIVGAALKRGWIVIAVVGFAIVILFLLKRK